MTDSCLGDLDWNCSGPITMEKKKKNPNSFSPHMETEPLSPRCYDSAGRCRYEPPLSDGDKVYKWQSESRKKIAPDFDWKPILLCEQSAHERGSGAPCLIQRWKLPLCIFIFILSRKAIRAMLCTCCQACKGLLNCLFDSFESAYPGQELQFRLI